MAQDDALRRCPTCEMKLWPISKVRPIKFHHIRHTTATLLLKAGVPLATVQKILRHSDPRLTAEIYGHLDIDDMRKGLNTLAASLPQNMTPDLEDDSIDEKFVAGLSLEADFDDIAIDQGPENLFCFQGVGKSGR